MESTVRVLLTIPLYALGVLLPAQTRVPASADNARVSFKVAGPICSIRQGCPIVVDVHNVSGTPIFLPHVNGELLSDFNADVHGPNSNDAVRHKRSSRVVDQFGDERPLASSVQFRRVEPGETCTQTADLSNGIDFPGPGHYVVTLYRASRWRKDYGPLDSAAADIDVVP